jgi:glutamate-5-semialdehyde dehydrogenase
MTEQLTERLKRCRTAALTLRTSSTNQRNEVLNGIAQSLLASEKEILSANQKDLAALKAETTAAFRDRLCLTSERIALAAESLRQVAALPDPLTEEAERRTLANGLLVRRVRSPLGVILMIFESRPNVALESFSLALKSGNVILLRGGKESMHTTGYFYSLIERALEDRKLPSSVFWGITDPDRALLQQLLTARRWIDVVVPRGGSQLIDFVVENARIAIIKNDRGLCHVYVHEDADLAMAQKIVVNAKTQRPGVCNSMETVLVHERIKEKFLKGLHDELSSFPVSWFGCPETLRILQGRKHVGPATDESWDTEYLDLKMNCRVVDSLGEAIEHIERHGSGHSESIVTRSEKSAKHFQSHMDAAAVYWNASTRFTDGFEFGLGGELGISTQKLHVRGPIGLRELTSLRWVIDGSGQVRG